MSTTHQNPTVDVPEDVYLKLLSLIRHHRPSAAYRFGDDWLSRVRPEVPTEARFWCLMAEAARMTGLKGGYERSVRRMKTCPDYSPGDHDPDEGHSEFLCILMVRIRDLW